MAVDWKSKSEFYNNYVVDKITITHNGRNVYLNGKIVFFQCSYGGYIEQKTAWNANIKEWENYNGHIQQRATVGKYRENVCIFIQNLLHFPLQPYLDSTNCEKYNKNLHISAFERQFGNGDPLK